MPDNRHAAVATDTDRAGPWYPEYDGPRREVRSLSLEDDLKAMIINELKVEDVRPEDLKDDDPLFGDGLGLDSLDAVELVLLLQKHYQVEIKDTKEAREPFQSIAALANFVRAHRNEA